MDDTRDRSPLVIRSSESVFSHDPWFRVYIDDVHRISSEEHHARIVESGGVPGVVILPVNETCVGLVRQFRVPIDAYAWGAPRGFGESASPLQDAQRELQEETGIKEADWIDLGSVFANSGLLATPVHIFIALVTTTPHKVRRVTETSDDEVEEFRWWSLDEIASAVRRDEISDGITLAALMKASLSGHLIWT